MCECAAVGSFVCRFGGDNEVALNREDLLVFGEIFKESVFVINRNQEDWRNFLMWDTGRGAKSSNTVY